MRNNPMVSAAALSAVALAAFITIAPALAQQAAPDDPAAPASPAEPRKPGGPEGRDGLRGWGPGTMMGPAMMGPRGFGPMCGAPMAGFAEWRIGEIERTVKPTEAQRAALDGLKAASTKAVDEMKAACPTEAALTPTGRMEAMEKRLEAMLQAVKTVRPALEQFYSSLTDEQKARFNTIGLRHGQGWGGMRERWRDR